MSTLQKLNINLKKILATTLVFVMITYYYLYVVSPQLTAWLPLVLIIGIVLSGIILVGFAITNKLTRWHCKYLLFYIAVLGISVIFQWPNVAWLSLSKYFSTPRWGFIYSWLLWRSWGCCPWCMLGLMVMNRSGMDLQNTRLGLMGQTKHRYHSSQYCSAVCISMVLAGCLRVLR